MTPSHSTQNLPVGRTEEIPLSLPPLLTLSEKPFPRVRAFTLSLVFLAGLVGLDQALFKGANYLSRTPSWPSWARSFDHDSARPSDADLLIVGTCHATLYLAPSKLKPLIGKKVANFGIAAEFLGTMAFTTEVVLSHNRNKQLILVIDDSILSQDRVEALSEIESNYLWWDVLEKKRGDYLLEKFSADPLRSALRGSGFWVNRGRGWTLLAALIGYNPTERKAEPIPVAPGAIKSYYRRDADNRWRPQKLAMSVVEDLVVQAKEVGVEPILVVPPSHPELKTDEENAQIVDFTRGLSERHKVPLLSYLDSKNIWSRTPSSWIDRGHLTAEARDSWLNVVAEDLKKVLK